MNEITVALNRCSRLERLKPLPINACDYCYSLAALYSSLSYPYLHVLLITNLVNSNFFVDVIVMVLMILLNSWHKLLMNIQLRMYGSIFQTDLVQI